MFLEDKKTMRLTGVRDRMIIYLLCTVPKANTCRIDRPGLLRLTSHAQSALLSTVFVWQGSIGGIVECDWSEWENEPSTLAGNNDNNNTDLAVKEHQSFSAMP